MSQEAIEINWSIKQPEGNKLCFVVHPNHLDNIREGVMGSARWNDEVIEEAVRLWNYATLLPMLEVRVLQMMAKGHYNYEFDEDKDLVTLNVGVQE